MADTRLSREANKQRLRANVISRNDDMGEGRRRPSLLVYVIMLLCALALMYGIYYYSSYTVSSDCTAVWQKDEENGGGDIETFRGFKSFAGGIIKYSKDGAEYIDKKGNVVWERSYQLNSPIIDTGSDYAVIADQGATSIYIFNGTEVTGASETLLPISLVKISDQGIVYAVLNDSDAEYITAFRPDGSAIDLSVKSIVNGDGYPFDIDTSPDGTQLISSYVSLSGGRISNNVVFRNFGSVGQNADARRVVGGFSDEFDGHIAGSVHFSANEYSQALYDGGIVFFSTKVLNSPEVLSNVTFDNKMLAAVSGENITAVLLDNSKAVRNDNNEASDTEASSAAASETADSADQKNGQGSAQSSRDTAEAVEIESSSGKTPYRLAIFDNEGRETGSADIDINYKDICLSGDQVIVYGTHDIRVYSAKGAVRGSFSYDDADISSIIGCDKSGSFYLVTGNSIMQMKY